MKRALITGGAKRLGRAMTLYLAERGLDVAIHYSTSREAAEETAEAARKQGVRAAILKADLLDEDQTAGLVDRAAAALGGPLGLLINNASIFEPDTIETATKDSWDRHIGSNLRAPYVLTQAFARQAPEAERVSEPVARAMIVNMVDQRVQKLTPDFSTYTLAKMGLWAFTQTAAQGLAPDIRVNAIGPGPTMRGARQTAAQFAAQRAATILERGADPSDICAALGYLLEAKAVTGQLICVDGGQHLGWKTPDLLSGE